MFSKLTNKILGKKAERGGPYSDIPIFENVDSIGLPGLNTVNLANEPSLQESSNADGENKTPSKSFPRSAMTTRSGQKRARDALLGDKENVPRLPGANNILDNDHQHQKGKVEKKTQYYDEKHADSDEEASVTVESVDEESDDEEEEERESPVKRSRVGDDRFHTERSGSTKAPARGKKVGFKVQEEPQDDNDDDQMEYDEEQGEYDEMEREQLFSKVRHGHQDWVKQYVNDKKSDVGKSPSWSVDERGNTLLHVAVQNNHKKMASMLIKLGVDVNKTNKKGMTCLDYAEMYHFNKLAQFLMGMDALNGMR